jgi:hypothetical protein
MKKIFLMAAAISSLFIYSCKTTEVLPEDETNGLIKVQQIDNDTNIVELYTESGKFMLGYNEVYLRIKNKTSGMYSTDADISWMPVMHMTMHSHSCPKSAIQKVAGKETLYKGYLVFQMPENATERWTLTLNYQVGGMPFVVEDTVAVPNSTRKRVTVITGADTKKYILALVKPDQPAVAVNDMVIGLYKMESMMSFPSVADFTIELDPRMPSMGNHSSPNNEHLTYNAADGMYHGKLSLTMTGYWKLNLMLKNELGELLKGEAVTADNESSSLFLEVEF